MISSLRHTKRLRPEHKLLALLTLPICLCIAIFYGWSAFATISERSGLYGDMYSYYNLSATTYTVLSGFICLVAIGFTFLITKHLITRNKAILCRSFWYFILFAALLLILELYLQTRFTGKP
jgi:hypothetical protein